MLHVPVSATTGLGCMREKSPWSQQGILGDTQPVFPLRDSPFSTSLGAAVPSSAEDPAPPSMASQMGGPTTHLSPFDSGGKLCLTAATNSATVSSRVKITALGPASNVYATWNPRGQHHRLNSGSTPLSPSHLPWRPGNSHSAHGANRERSGGTSARQLRMWGGGLPTPVL